MKIALVALAAALVAGLGGSVSADASSSSTSRLITELSWSPDGKWLAFVAETDPSGLRPGVQILRVVRVDQGVQRVVYTSSPNADLSGIKWARDSKRFAILEFDHSVSSYSTWISSANGRGVRRFRGAFTDWSPNSRDFLVARDGST